VVAAPLGRTRVMGVINVTDDRRTDPFEADEIRILQLFADQAAIALENARLLEEARRAAHCKPSPMWPLRCAAPAGEMMPVILSAGIWSAQGPCCRWKTGSARDRCAAAPALVAADRRTPGLRGVRQVMATGGPRCSPKLKARRGRSCPRPGLPAVALVPLIERRSHRLLEWAQRALRAGRRAC
jgi:hypothetical protein